MPEGESIAPDTGTGGTPAWHAGFDAETLGHLQNRGLDAKTAPEAVAELVKAHREAEKLIGAPADRMVRLPKDEADVEGLKAFRAKLGVPESADKYDLSGVKFGDGSELDPKFVEAVRATAYTQGLNPTQAQALAQSFVKFMEDAELSTKAEGEAKLIAERAILDKDWGANKEANLFIAKQAAIKLGIDPEALSALEGQVGYVKVMQMMHKVGVSMGEDKFISNEHRQGGVITREQAVAKKAELMNDSQWVNRYMNGDVAANAEMKSLLVVITGESDANYEAA